MYPKFTEWREANEQVVDEPIIELPVYVPKSHRQDEFIQAVLPALGAAARGIGSAVGAVGRNIGTMASKGMQGANNLAQQGANAPASGGSPAGAQPQEQPQQEPQQQQQEPQQQQQQAGPSLAQRVGGLMTNKSATMDNSQDFSGQAQGAGMSKMGGKSRSRKSSKKKKR